MTDIRAAITAAIREVTDGWDEPLDEVHDVPQIVNAILALLAGQEAVPIEYRDITPTCVANRNLYPAWFEAASALWEVFQVQRARHPDATFRLSIADRAALDPEEPRACNRGPCHLPGGHDGRCNPGRDALPRERYDAVMDSGPTNPDEGADCG